MDIVTIALMLGSVMFGALIIIVIDLFVSNKKPAGELIFKKINNDEAKVELKLYEDCLYNTVNAKKVVFKVVRE